jgi:folate-binding protein YgfZ
MDRGFVDLSSWRKLWVEGADADGWLNDLVSADVSALAPGRARRSLLLSPTGRIRADFTASRWKDGWLLVQDPVQPMAVADLLEPYVLSSDVRLMDRTGDLALIAVPGERRLSGSLPLDPATHPGSGTAGYSPSVLGPGIDLVGRDHASLAGVTAGLVEVSEATVDAWRIQRGHPRFGVDLGPDSLPQEAASTESALSYGKGCFLGQEAVARVRNLGHPPFVVLTVRSHRSVATGDAVLADGEDVGRVTSVAPLQQGGAAAIVRVRWTARDSEFRTAAGSPLVRSGSPAGAG